MSDERVRQYGNQKSGPVGPLRNFIAAIVLAAVALDWNRNWLQFARSRISLLLTHGFQSFVIRYEGIGAHPKHFHRAFWLIMNIDQKINEARKVM